MAPHEMVLAEIRRLQYLEAMGIDSYVPRRVLPGALPSLVLDWPLEVRTGLAAPESPTASTALAANTAAADKSTLLRLQQDLGGAQRKTPAAARQPANTAVTKTVSINTASSPRNVLQFQLAIFHPVKEWLVLVPAQHTDARHLHLLKNILLALALKTDDLVPVDNFVWPPRVAASAKVNPALEAARETLHSLLEGYQLKHRTKNILVFAGELADILFPLETHESLAIKNLELVCLPELQQMLEDSQYKKTTWQQIRHLAL